MQACVLYITGAYYRRYVRIPYTILRFSKTNILYFEKQLTYIKQKNLGFFKLKYKCR